MNFPDSNKFLKKIVSDSSFLRFSIGSTIIMFLPSIFFLKLKFFEGKTGLIPGLLYANLIWQLGFWSKFFEKVFGSLNTSVGCLLVWMVLMVFGIVFSCIKNLLMLKRPVIRFLISSAFLWWCSWMIFSLIFYMIFSPILGYEVEVP